MKVQERKPSDFDRIIFPPSTGDTSVVNCVQAISAALGFAISAGWDWLPSMHTLWLRDFLASVHESGSADTFDMLSGSIFFKMSMLLALSPLMERLFRAFPAASITFRQPSLPSFWHKFFPRAISERIYLSCPLALAQLFAVVLLSLQSFFLTQSSPIVLTLLLGTTSALFALIWFLLVAVLPGVWSCIAYGLALAFSMFISMFLDAIPAESLASTRILCPLMAVPLLPLAVPPADEIRRRVRRHHWQRLFKTHFSRQLKDFFSHGFSFTEICCKRGNDALVLLVFPILYGIQILLDYSIGCPLISFKYINNFSLGQHTFLILSGEVSGAFLASSLLVFFPNHSLLVPLLGLSLFGCGSLLTSILPFPPLNSIPFYLLHLSSGCCGAYGLFILHLYFRRTGFLFRILGWTLFLLVLFGSLGGYLLWSLADSIHNVYLTSHAIFMHLLTIGTIFGLFFIYLMRRSLLLLQDKTPLTPLEEVLSPLVQADPFELLTPREREVAELVRLGMKNLEISAQLNITETTLRVHLRRIYRKLGIQGRSNLRDFHNLE